MWAMKDPAIDALLVLQTHDLRRIALEAAIAQAPQRAAALADKRAQVEAAFAQQQRAQTALELRRSDLRTQRRSLEGNIVKYKAQQAQVRKAEEFEAFAKQIAEAEAKVGEWETEELTLLFQIDEGAARLAEDKKTHAQKLSDLEGQVRAQAAELAQTKLELAEKIEAVKQSAAAVAPTYLKAYEQVKVSGKKPPFVVVLKDHVCGGCHTRAATTGLENAKTAPAAPVFCPNCSRMLYTEA